MGKKAASKAKPRGRGTATVQPLDGDPLRLSESQQSLVAKIQAKGLAGLTKSEREQIELYGPVLIAAFPKVRYLECAGRQSRTVIDQTKRHELPYPSTGKAVDLRRFIRWAHDFLARHGQALNSRASVDDEAFAAADAKLKQQIAEAVLEQRQLANQEKKINIQKKLHELVPVQPVQEFWAEAGGRMQQMVNAYRGSGSVTKASVIKRMNDLLDDLDRMAEEKFGSGGDDTDRAA